MQYEPVGWLEGMFLRPHHLQTAERAWAEASATQVSLDNHYSYGLRRISFSREAVANGQFELTQCQARMKDGTVISLSIGQEPDRVDVRGGEGGTSDRPRRDLAAAFESDEVVRVYLAIPKLRLGRANLQPQRGGQHRYVELPAVVPDENQGGNEQEITQRSLNVQLLIGSDNLAGYEVLPIAQIKRSGASEAAPELDAEYIPPVLACDAWPELARDYVRAVYDIIGQKIEVLSNQVISRGIMTGASEPGDINRLLMLTSLNTASAALRCLAFAQGVHPLVAYTELCRIVGSLSIFRDSRRPGEIPHYDHDDLARIFRWVKEEIAALITEVQDYSFQQRDFIGAGRGMQVSLDSRWLGRDWEWFIGVHHGKLSAQQCRELLMPGKLDWKLGASDKVDWMFKFSVPGLQLEETVPPRALPQGQDWLFYQVRKNGAAWNQLQAQNDPSLGARFKEDLINNLDTLQGKKEMRIVSQGIDATLRLTLFAVPKNQ